MRTLTAHPTRRRGFTLMEVLVVLAILVMLVGMVVPRILGTQKKAAVSAAKTQLGMLKACLERYALDCKTFPSTEQGLQSLLEKPADMDESVAWDGPYINSAELPKDPWGRDYGYEYPPTRGSGDRPDIWSRGPDGEDDTEDDIVSWSKTEGETGSSSSSGSSP